MGQEKHDDREARLVGGGTWSRGYREVRQHPDDHEFESQRWQ
jgi:hypothetical protein